jgi:hypothetical protein
MKIGTGIKAILRFCLRNMRGLNVGITDGRYLLAYAAEMASCGMIYLQSFMKIGTGVLAISRFCLRNKRGCNVGITDVRGHAVA